MARLACSTAVGLVLLGACFRRLFSAARAVRLISRLLCSSGMADASVCAWWCCALVCALALVAADGLLVDITYVESAVAKGAGERS